MIHLNKETRNLQSTLNLEPFLCLKLTSQSLLVAPITQGQGSLVDLIAQGFLVVLISQGPLRDKGNQGSMRKSNTWKGAV